MLCAMIAGSALVVFAVSRPEPPAPAPVIEPPHEAPWLTREAAAQVIADDGTLGPLFAGVELGGPPPSAAVRARIADFARANRVDIRFDVADDELAVVRFSVTFGGCCGYEGAGVLALRLHRPKGSQCCGCENVWIDDWSTVSDDGAIRTSVRVRINRVEVRWEPTLSMREVLERADHLFGADPHRIAEASGDRWITAESGKRYLLEEPFPTAPYPDFGWPPRLGDREDLGYQLAVERGRINQVKYALFHIDDVEGFEKLARATWGHPRVADEHHLEFHKPDRVVTVELDGYRSLVTIAAP